MLEVVFWGIVILAAFALLGRVWLHLYLRVQMGREAGNTVVRGKVVPIDSYRGRKPRRQSVG